MKKQKDKSQQLSNEELQTVLEEKTTALEQMKRMLEVEAALEKVRSRTMAMQHSNELQDAANLLFQQVQALGIPAWSCGYNIWEIEDKVCTGWMSSKGLNQPPFEIPLTENPTFIRFYDSRQKGESFYVEERGGEALEADYRYMLSLPGLGEQIAVFLKAGFTLPAFQINHVANFSHGNLIFITYEPVPESWDIFKRFATVFEQTYTRFLDIQKAEAQVRESQIEASLERVRSKAMAMHRSEDLALAVATIFEELEKLNLGTLRCGIGILDKEKRCVDVWTTTKSDKGVIAQVSGAESMDSHPLLQGAIDAWLKQEDYDYVLEGEDLYSYYQTQTGANFRLPLSPSILSKTEGLKEYYHLASFKAGGLYAFRETAFPDEAKTVMKRFAIVFNQTYTRFLDLQKAEAQAREAQIELALERVRARTMAMQRSDELADVAMLLFQQVKELGIRAWVTGFNIWQADNASYIDWITGPSGDFLEPYTVDLTTLPVFIAVREARQRGDDFFVSVVEGEQIVKMYELLNSFGDKGQFEKILNSGIQFPTRQFNHFVFGAQVSLLFITYEPCPEAWDIFKRFGKIFEQTYTRFLDLQKAESQAREAQIELGLERVRARAMAMQKSDELAELIDTLQKELTKLEFTLNNCIFWIMQEEPPLATWWIAPVNKTSLPESYRVPFANQRYFKAVFKAWKERITKWVYELKGKDKKEADQYIFTETDLTRFPDDVKKAFREVDKVYISFSFYNYGGLHISTKEPLTEERLEIVNRFSKVFDMTYTRFLDLQKAEAQAREAKIETALERVRARTMAMQKSDELDETNMLILRQLESLDISLSGTGIHICYSDKPESEAWMGDPLTGKMPKVIYNHTHDRLSEKMYEGWKKGETLYVEEVKGEKLKEHFDYVLSLLPDPTIYEDSIPEFVFHIVYFTYGFFVLATPDHRPTEHPVFIRFAKVFEQTYTRFLDLQKAEAQAREAKIEAALEKVRSRTMVMQRSEELSNVATVLFQQVKSLGVPQWTCGFCIWDIGDTVSMWYPGSPDGEILAPMRFPLTEHPVFRIMDESRKRGDELYIYEKEGEVQADHYRYMMTLPGVREVLQGMLDSGLKIPTFQIDHYANFAYGNLIFITYEHFPEMHDIFKRFAKVFEQTYTRFLDLQKAEAQAREAQIEAALERIRSRSMAMHKSEELLQVITEVSEQLQHLKLKFNTVSFAINNQDHDYKFWFAVIGNTTPLYIQVPYLKNPMFDRVKEGLAKGIRFYADTLTPEESRQWHEHVFAHTDMPFLSEETKAYVLRSGYARSVAIMPNIMLIISNYAAQPYADDENDIIRRFAAVFEQSYTRFLDLQKAEANAREAQTEAGLERVRARTMAMHSSEDVSVATATMFTELEKLGIQNLRGGITIIRPDQTQEVWSVNNLPDGTVLRAIGVFDMRLHPFWQQIFEAYKRKEDFDYYWLAGKDKQDYIAILNAKPNYLAQPIKEIPDVHVQSYFFGEGGVWTNSLQPHSEEDKQIMKRFTSVFSLTFRRYQDLKKAEAQTREATIESALEKVRGKAMSMNDSKDLSSTIVLAFSELKKLGINPLRFGVGLINKELHKAQLYAATSSADGDGLALIGWIVFKGHPVFENIYESWIKNEDYYPILEGEQLKSYYELLLSGLSVPEIPDWQSGEKQYGHFFPQPVSCLYAWANQALNETDIKILKRFASIIELTFRRYLELQKSEANARDAIRRASLDRVRAETASMRTTADLEKITPLIWNELTTLGVPFTRCGVFIMDETQKEIHTFLSTPDGKAIAAFHLPYHTTEQTTQIVAHWQQKKFYKDHWDEAAFDQWTKTLVQKGIIASQEQYVKTSHPANLHLHFLPFLQGMLYVGNEAPFNEEEIQLVQSLADAFSTAYARYEDFNKLESAKEQIEKTLVDLKQAQAQLVQSEKMASLGQLTAGIAHEIQNPLNFVNNFSEVNTELIEELKKELKEGNKEEVIAIANDIKANEEKINHHGKRADAIVKGMLQHSRSSSALKEPTDINKLADEYLRLAYHGLRAKDKSFNATMKTDFDEAIGNINIVPQDIGRVLLNLYNNAFYAITEKKKQLIDGNEPTVSVSTKKINDKVEIKVKDNGIGIPQKVLDKIFQPFFTTKPTGQGTGLGLSLAYDIVKAHGGELRVETKEREGAEFVIQIPAK